MTEPLTTSCPACGAQVQFREREDAAGVLWLLDEHEAAAAPGERCFATEVRPLGLDAAGKAAPLPAGQARGENARMQEIARRAVMWNTWNERTGHEYGWSKTHVVEAPRRSARGVKTLCGAVVPVEAEILDGTDIRTSPCRRCLRAAGKPMIGSSVVERAARELYAELERW